MPRWLSDRIETRRWRQIEKFLQDGEEHKAHTPARLGKSAMLVYLTDRRIIFANFLDAKYDWLVGCQGVEFSDIDPPASGFYANYRLKVSYRRVTLTSGDISKTPGEWEVDLFPSPISLAFVENLVAAIGAPLG